MKDTILNIAGCLLIPVIVLSAIWYYDDDDDTPPAVRQLNEEFEYDDFTFTINDVSTARVKGRELDSLLDIPDGAAGVIVEYEVKNQRKREVNFSPNLKFQLEDGQGRQFDAHDESTIDGERRKSLIPGVSEQGEVAFVLPNDAITPELVLKIKDSELFSNGHQRVTLDLP